MKMIGMLIVMGLVLALTYILAQDMGYLATGEGDKTTLDAVGITGKVVDKINSSSEQLRQQIENQN